ncbi:uncharacterized protein E0L32_004978 [Thyridium curvatum]|uniref:Uncharacterized protein n=1 Tax=Thyridium curvatum TaxID=1093900 RepID=A0A507BBV1_9PEZI|nr:uncharacterized protein E0L32_004978 [Thyridium curvatum]TPX14869.1 hypothetical protein E0L32_004978 [Thyridium curvatum]
MPPAILPIIMPPTAMPLRLEATTVTAPVPTAPKGDGPSKARPTLPPPSRETKTAAGAGPGSSCKHEIMDLLAEYDKVTWEQRLDDARTLLEVRRLMHERLVRERGGRRQPRVFRPPRQRRRTTL